MGEGDQAIEGDPDQAIKGDPDQAIEGDPDQAIKGDPDQAIKGDPETEGDHKGRPYYGRLPLCGGEAAVGAML